MKSYAYILCTISLKMLMSRAIVGTLYYREKAPSASRACSYIACNHCMPFMCIINMIKGRKNIGIVINGCSLPREKSFYKICQVNWHTPVWCARFGLHLHVAFYMHCYVQRSSILPIIESPTSRNMSIGAHWSAPHGLPLGSATLHPLVDLKWSTKQWSWTVALSAFIMQRGTKDSRTLFRNLKQK
jgi:hypothetical protein